MGANLSQQDMRKKSARELQLTVAHLSRRESADGLLQLTTPWAAVSSQYRALMGFSTILPLPITSQEARNLK